MGPQNIGRGFGGENDGNPKWMVTKKVATAFFFQEKYPEILKISYFPRLFLG